MRVPAAVYIVLGLGITLGATVPGSASAQVPTAESQPRLAVPARGAVIQTAAPAPAAAPAAQAPGQPTTAPTAAAAPADQPAPVSAAPPPSGVTQLPPTNPAATSSTSNAATAARAYSAGRFGLTVDGVQVGPLKAVEGGEAVADIVALQLGSDLIPKKHVANLKWEDLAFDVGLDSKPLMDWIASTWKGSLTTKNATVQFADYNFNVVSEREFDNALITSTTIPTLDLTSKESGFLTVTIAPERVQERTAGGKLSLDSKGQKRWLVSNFRFEMDGLDGTRVNRIESFTVGQKVAADQLGVAREPLKHPVALEFPNLKITLPEAYSQSWAKWREDFLLKGNHDEAQEKNGAIVLLDPLKSELGRINLFNCGLVRFGRERQQANSDTMARVTADVYCERMEFMSKGGLN